MSLEGSVLIAHPNSPKESFFYKSVIYLYQDKEKHGSIGLITNKPSRYSLAEVFQEKNLPFGITGKIYHGGPVNTNALLLLHSPEWTSINTQFVQEDLCLTSDDNMLKKIATGDHPAHWRLFGGLCGWGPGQLQAELKGRYPYKPENSWLIAKIDKNTLLNTSENEQWEMALELSSQQMFDQYF